MNIDPAPATIKNHGEIETPTAMPPAIARKTNPDATAARSSTGSCFSHTLYAKVNARYPPITSASCHRAANDSRIDATASPIPAAIAVLTATSPAATGRYRLVGCTRSASTSIASFTKYVPLAARQKHTNAIAVRKAGVPSKSTPAAGAATTRTFFSHCFGRARAQERRKPGVGLARFGFGGLVVSGSLHGASSDLERLVLDVHDEPLDRVHRHVGLQPDHEAAAHRRRARANRARS